MPKIVVVGSANTDFVLGVPELPTKGQTVLGGAFRVARGGKGANQAVAAARLGGEVTFVARLGSDSFGDEAVAAYQREGIETGFIIRDVEVPSGVALIMVNPGGENIIAVAPGANGRLTPEDVLAARAAIEEADCLLVQLEVPLDAVEAALEIAHQGGVKTILNPAPAQRLPARMLALVDILTPNETEAAGLAGETLKGASAESLTRLASLLNVHTVVVTLGSRGACITEGEELSMVHPFPVTPVDTTACGDAFNGALSVALARHELLGEAVKYANAAGALTATRHGAQPSLPTSRELGQFMATSAPGPSPAVPSAEPPRGAGTSS